MFSQKILHMIDCFSKTTRFGSIRLIITNIAGGTLDPQQLTPGVHVHVHIQSWVTNG